VVLHGPDSIYGTRLAQADDLALLVEIADTSYSKDSEPKLRHYAGFRIPVYWIVDRNRRIIEIRMQPYGKGKQAGYARCDVYQEHNHVPVVLDGDEVGRLAVANLLP
jgi:Uma2 family endonuclease